jgi:hypothetical protein
MMVYSGSRQRASEAQCTLCNHAHDAHAGAARAHDHDALLPQRADRQAPHLVQSAAWQDQTVAAAMTRRRGTAEASLASCWLPLDLAMHRAALQPHEQMNKCGTFMAPYRPARAVAAVPWMSSLKVLWWYRYRSSSGCAWLMLKSCGAMPRVYSAQEPRPLLDDVVCCETAVHQQDIAGTSNCSTAFGHRPITARTNCR